MVLRFVNSFGETLQPCHLTFQYRLVSNVIRPIFNISLCAEPHLEPSQTSAGQIVWRFSFQAEFPSLFSVTVSEAAVRSCPIKKVEKFCKIQRKTPVLESAIFSSCWTTKK